MTIETELKDAIAKSGIGNKDREPSSAPPAKYVPAKHRNSNGVDPHSLLEQGLSAHVAVVEERNRLAAELDAARLKIKELETELEVQERDFNTIESRVNSCIAQRDAAVVEAGELRGVLRAIGDMVARYESDETKENPPGVSPGG